MERVLIAGCGYVGSRLAGLLAADGCSVYGLKRDPSTLPAAVHGIGADVSDPSTLVDLPGPLDALIYAVSPLGRSEPEYLAAYVDGLRNVIQAVTPLAGPALRSVLVSSTGVYGQVDGRWVDEKTAPEPAGPSARALLEGERVIREAAGTSIVLRLGGIYGPGRTRTVQGVLDGTIRCPPPDRYGNRIHRDDAAAAIRHLLRTLDPDFVYIGVDRDPAPLRDVYRWIAHRAAATDPCASEEPEAASFDVQEEVGRRGTNKRCSSQRLVDSGFHFAYPSFRQGYAPIIDALT